MGDLLSNDSFLTQGLLGDVLGDSAYVRLGLPVYLLPPKKPDQSVQKIATADSVVPGTGRTLVLPKGTTIFDVNGNMVLPTALGKVDLGGGHVLDFDPATFNGRITPSLASDLIGTVMASQDSGMCTYTGSDCRVMIEIAEPEAGLPRYAKQLLELTTRCPRPAGQQTLARARGPDACQARCRFGRGELGRHVFYFVRNAIARVRRLRQVL